MPVLEDALRYERSASSVASLNSTTLSERERTKLVAVRLLALSQKCRDMKMSGRALRRLPVLAHARYIGHAFSAPSSTSTGAPSASGMAIRVEVWLAAMERVLHNHADEIARFEK